MVVLTIQICGISLFAQDLLDVKIQCYGIIMQKLIRVFV